MEYYSAIKKNEILPFAATWMNLQNIILSEISQRQILYDITYMWNLKNNMNEFIYKTKRFTDIENKHGYRRGRWINQEHGINRYTSFYIKQTRNKDLQHSTRDSLAIPGSSVGKESACHADFLGREDPLEKGKATHSSIPAWEIPWTEEPSGLHSVRSQKSDTTQQLNLPT